MTSVAVRRRLYRSGWLIVLCAVCSYLLVAFAEQGSAGAGMRVVPDAPLPFERHMGIGIDLSDMSSLAALEWLEQTDTSSIPMILVPVDGDIITAFNDPDTYLAARTALDHLIDAARPAPITMCLQRPVTALDEATLAEAVVTVIVESYTDRVTYIASCSPGSPPSWEASILTLLGSELPTTATERVLAPVSVGAELRLQDPVTIQSIDDGYLDGLAGTRYVATRFTSDAPLSDGQRQSVHEILHDRSHIALVLTRPHPSLEPASVVAALTVPLPERPELSEGYNSALSPPVSWRGEWIPTQVGPVTYQRTVETGSWFTVEFVGTEVWLVGLVSPDGGRLGVWIDADDPQTASDPERIVSLQRTQAADLSLLLMDGLPAARHRMTVVAADGDVSIAGLFVTGRPEAGWHGGLGAIGIIALAIAGVAVVLTVTVDDLRARIGLDRDDGEGESHPRVFRRDI